MKLPRSLKIYLGGYQIRLYWGQIQANPYNCTLDESVWGLVVSGPKRYWKFIRKFDKGEYKGAIWPIS